jgi:hypothetical protein
MQLMLTPVNPLRHPPRLHCSVVPWHALSSGVPQDLRGLHRVSKVEPPLRLNQSDYSVADESPTIVGVVDDIRFFGKDPRFCEQSLQNAGPRRPHAGISLANPNGSVETLALHDDPGMGPVPREPYVDLAPIRGPCNVKHGRGGRPPLRAMGCPGVGVANSGWRRCASAALARERFPPLLHSTTVVEPHRQPQSAIGPTFDMLDRGKRTVPNAMRKQRFTEADPVAYREFEGSNARLPILSHHQDGLTLQTPLGTQNLARQPVQGGGIDISASDDQNVLAMQTSIVRARAASSPATKSSSPLAA